MLEACGFPRVRPVAFATPFGGKTVQVIFGRFLGVTGGAPGKVSAREQFMFENGRFPLGRSVAFPTPF